MPKLKAIPRSKAKTAWGLCADVIRVIMAEPKRADIGSYITKESPKSGGPACGTVGCFAGWLTLLKGGREGMSVGQHAVSLLGNNIDYRTVGPNRDYVFNSGEGDTCGTTIPGTLSHACAIAARIRKFMTVNEKALRARKV